ncbi:PH domain-containing protein [Amycolatopsis minnesotensis]|uniref:PH domain-containing protein n=1 Tax=Amycolatopsis minnesotensis TaxID=337894 RepID=A0ABN2RN57_9PSEU
MSRRAVRYWTARAALGWLALTAGQVVWFVLDRHDAGIAHIIGLAVTVLLAAAHLAVMPRWRFAVHRWETTADVVYAQSGWVNRERRLAPMSRIQTVDTQQGLFERAFRLTNVTVTTASARGPIRVHALDDAVAENLVAEITARAGAAEDDAT